MMVKNKKDVNTSEEFTPNNSVKNQVQYTNYSRNAIKIALNNSVNNIKSLVVELNAVKKDLCIKTNHYQSYKTVSDLLTKLLNFLNVEFKTKTLDFGEFIAYSKFKDPNTSGIRITINIRPKNKGYNVMLDYYKNRYYNDVIIKTFHTLEKALENFSLLHITHTHKRRILNSLLNEVQEIRKYLKRTNILHLLYFKRELKNLDLKNNNINSIICYYYWTEKTNYIIENDMDLWIN